ncbi:MAG: type III-B CRISPR module RAMP protein Cmr6, partial [Cyclobacteriaceae bacterium]
LMLGFSFDHTSGLPVIPGSSIKGLLRFACKAEKGAYFRQLLQEIRPDLKAVDYEQFINAVFEGTEGEKPLRINRRDVFFDALPVRSHHPEQHFLGEDYITPHLHRDDRSMDGLKNPIPLKFLKILPEVVFEFRFLLSGEKAGISATDRKKIFRQILLDLGIGAKTNVGYGQFVEETEAERAAAGKLAEQMQQQILQQQEEARIKKETAAQAEKDKDFQASFQEIKPELTPDQEEETVDGTIFRKAGTKYYIRYKVNGKTCEKMRLRKHFVDFEENPKEGDAITVTISRDTNNNGLSIQITKKN